MGEPKDSLNNVYAWSCVLNPTIEQPNAFFVLILILIVSKHVLDYMTRNYQKRRKEREFFLSLCSVINYNFSR
jgi:hypothetical protein